MLLEEDVFYEQAFSWQNSVSLCPAPFYTPRPNLPVTTGISCLENPMNSIKRQKDRTLKDELPRLAGAQYATAYQWRNNSRENEETKPKQKQHPAVVMTGDGSKV